MRKTSVWRFRVAGLAFVIAALWYAPWLDTNPSQYAARIAYPFAAASLFVAAALLVALVSDRHRRVLGRKLVVRRGEPRLAVSIPTCHEPLTAVDRTARSVHVGWPRIRHVPITLDDGRDPAVATLTRSLRLGNPGATVAPDMPPLRGAPKRRVDAEAAMLGSMSRRLDGVVGRVALVGTPGVEHVDRDPLVLRESVGQLLAGGRVAFARDSREVCVKNTHHTAVWRWGASDGYEAPSPPACRSLAGPRREPGPAALLFDSEGDITTTYSFGTRAAGSRFGAWPLRAGCTCSTAS